MKSKRLEEGRDSDKQIDSDRYYEREREEDEKGKGRQREGEKYR